MRVRLVTDSAITKLSWGLFVLLAISILFSALSNPASHRLPAIYPASPKTTLPAHIEPAMTFTLQAEFPGKVTSVLVSQGMNVKPGQTLALLDSTELTADVERARRRLKFAETRLATAQAAEKRNGTARIQREQFESAKKARKAAAERLEAFSAADAEKSYDQARERLSQIRALLDQQLATRAELDECEAREQIELRNLKAAREHRSRLKQEFDSADSQVRVATMHSEVSSGGALQSAQMEVEDARNSLRVAIERVLTQRIAAQSAGTVLEIPLHPGERVVAGTPLLKIADLSRLTFEVPVAAKLAEQIPTGSPVVVRLPTDPPMLIPASVSSVILVPDQASQSYLVRITIPNPNPAAILAGLEGAVEFHHLER